ncbi:hypothetical protein J4G48_0040780 [Bradyrhizobium barranii subsp. apii]|uniref:hypothetical protein n=1 Tax=Bradyrhizobium barranii TaxID=2992140 RepID=UPI001AA0E5F4|nr:hypothetical protein [Bradyrhizobium barranii]UPT95493.1 hypothetical protein J4G48_0040780 [Bradyrhizobium barranii subsp. apii]
MNPGDLATLAVNNMNAATKLGLPMKEAHLLVTTPKGWKAPPKFPRGKIVQVKEDGSRIRYLPAMNLLAWLAANGFVKLKSEDRDDYRIET